MKIFQIYVIGGTQKEENSLETIKLTFSSVQQKKFLEKHFLLFCLLSQSLKGIPKTETTIKVVSFDSTKNNYFTNKNLLEGK